MIHDKMENLLHYVSEDKKEALQKFLDIISPDMEEGSYEIQGKDMYARVMSYEGKPKEGLKIEAHDVYLDVQFTLQGAEGIEVFERSKLEAKAPYNEEKDVQLYNETAAPYLGVANLPGYFSMLYREEAHKPQVLVDGYGSAIKKGVIKIKAYDRA